MMDENKRGISDTKPKRNERKSDSYWKELGITFTIPSEDDAEEILEFYRREFIPDEPVLRSLDLLGGNGWIDRYVHHLVLDDILYPSVKSPTSVIARNSEGKLVGLRLGKIHDHATPIPSEPSFRWAVNVPFFPTRLVAIGLVQIYLDRLDYGMDKAFQQLDCKGKIYFGQAVCVGKEVRGKGLGEELVRKANDIARANGCEYTYLLASGVYSQAIFSKLGYKVRTELKYEDILDSYGKPIIWDYREHKITQLVYLKF